jgi:hypothetical protein
VSSRKACISVGAKVAAVPNLSFKEALIGAKYVVKSAAQMHLLSGQMVRYDPNTVLLFETKYLKYVFNRSCSNCTLGGSLVNFYS